MTNYNERFDEILLSHGAEQGEFHYSLKQAITSLIKELVAEAKPAGASIDIIETYLQNGMPEKAAEYRGINHARDQFEQNLLKALEEK